VTRAGAALWSLSASALIFTGCATPVLPSPTGGTLFQGTTNGVQYRSALPRDVSHPPSTPREAYGQSCTTTLTFPMSPSTPFYGSDVALQVLNLRQPLALIVGDAGFAAAVANARQSVQNAPLYDVRVDLHTITVLSLYRRDCLEIHASALSAAAGPRQ
jgi:hypothetical protein